MPQQRRYTASLVSVSCRRTKNAAKKIALSLTRFPTLRQEPHSSVPKTRPGPHSRTASKCQTVTGLHRRRILSISSTQARFHPRLWPNPVRAITHSRRCAKRWKKLGCESTRSSRRFRRHRCAWHSGPPRAFPPASRPDLVCPRRDRPDCRDRRGAAGNLGS